MRLQEADGSIVGKAGLDGAALISTSFALLFLSKGRTPVSSANSPGVTSRIGAMEHLSRFP